MGVSSLLKQYVPFPFSQTPPFFLRLVMCFVVELLRVEKSCEGSLLLKREMLCRLVKKRHWLHEKLLVGFMSVFKIFR